MNSLFIGRFQPFHNGHLHIITQILEEVDGLIIGIGSAQHGFTKENPFTAKEREELISLTLSNEGLKNFKIIKIPDVNDDDKWVGHVSSLVPEFDIVYSNNPLVKTLFTKAGKDVRTFSFFKREECSGTEVRRRILNGEEWKNLVPKTIGKMVEAYGIGRIKGLD